MEQFDPIPNEIEDKQAFANALENRTIFLMQIQDRPVNSLKQIKSLMQEDFEQIQIVLGMPLLHTVQVGRTVEFVRGISMSDCGRGGDF